MEERRIISSNKIVTPDKGHPACLICGNAYQKMEADPKKDFICPYCVLWLCDHPRVKGESLDSVRKRFRGVKYILNASGMEENTSDVF